MGVLFGAPCALAWRITRPLPQTIWVSFGGEVEFLSYREARARGGDTASTRMTVVEGHFLRAPPVVSQQNSAGNVTTALGRVRLTDAELFHGSRVPWQAWRLVRHVYHDWGRNWVAYRLTDGQRGGGACATYALDGVDISRTWDTGD
jgi:hypothetical protein